MSVCANCGSHEGPFYRNWREKGLVVVPKMGPFCKPTKSEPDRVAKCVARRDKMDLDKYKEIQSDSALEAGY